MRKVKVPPCAIPETVRDEQITVPEGETRYILILDDATVELLAQGICSEDLAKRAWGCLDWKREYHRMCAREHEADELDARGQPATNPSVRATAASERR
jgi:hypothetical protein